MATKKKAAKKTATKKKSIFVPPPFALRFDPRIKGDPPPPWLRTLDVARQRELQAWVNAIINKVGR